MTTILLADDEKDITSIIKESLEYYLDDIEIIIANNGLEAYLAADKYSLDLIITDYFMPFMTGDEFIKALREYNPNNNAIIPVIFVSGFLPKFKDFFEHDQDVILLEKPFDDEKIVKYARMLLGKKLEKISA